MIFCQSIIINNSIFLVFLFFLLSIFLSYLLYRKHDSLADVSKYLKWVLFTLRFFTFFLLFLLLLNPELKKSEKITHSPVIIFLQDNSSSLIANPDSLYYKSIYLDKLNNLFASLKADIKIFSFSDLMESGFGNFEGETTNFSSLFTEASSLFSNLNISAYILASDGIYNKGLNPIYTDIHLNAPLHTLLLGDTMKHPDIEIQSIKHNKVTYLGNKSPIQVVFNANSMKGLDVEVEIFDNSQNALVFSKKMHISSDNYIDKVDFLISPSSPGLKKYNVIIKSNFTEKNMINNQQFFFIDVIDDRNKILLLFSTPHPDVASLKESIESQDQYEIDSYWLSDLNESVFDFSNYKDYSLVILHQLNDNDLAKHSNIKNHNIPTWYIVGSNTDISQFNSNQSSVNFLSDNYSFEYANTVLNRNFSSFLISDSLADFLSLSTPFLVPFSDVSILNLSEVLLSKKIGSLNTQQPILFFTEDEVRSAYLLGEGLWRWRLNNSYLQNNNQLFNTFISKIIQNLLVDEDKNRLYVTSKSIQSFNERVVFETELYNKNFELINSYPMSLVLTDSAGTDYDYQFNPLNDKYFLDVGFLNPGKYKFIIETRALDQLLIKKGEIIVSDFSIESRNLVANHQFLSDLSSLHGGTSVYMDSLEFLLTSITNSSDFKPKTELNYYFQPLIGFKSLFILIFFVLFLEWILRRRYINY